MGDGAEGGRAAPGAGLKGNPDWQGVRHDQDHEDRRARRRRPGRSCDPRAHGCAIEPVVDRIFCTQTQSLAARLASLAHRKKLLSHGAPAPLPRPDVIADSAVLPS